MARSTGLAMSWDEWSKHDAMGLAALVRKHAVTPREVVRQAARAVELVNPRLGGVLEVYEDVLDRPGADGPAGTAPSTACRSSSRISAPACAAGARSRGASCSGATSCRQRIPR